MTKEILKWFIRIPLAAAFAVFLTGAAHSQDLSLAWAKRMGGSSSEGGWSIALDAAGNVYTTGSFSGTVDFDPGVGVYNLVSASAGNDDIFVSKLDAAGNFVWAKRMGGSDSDYGISIAIDATGNVLTMGIFKGQTDFDPGPGVFNLIPTNSSSYSTFVSKLDADGNFVWAKGIGTDQSGVSTIVGSITLDPSGNVYITRYFYASTDFDPGPGIFSLTSAGSYDIFVSKLDPAGNFLWAKRIGGTDADYATAIVIEAGGGVYVTGIFSGTADFDPGPGVFNLISVGDADIFVCKLNASGNFVWAKRMGGTESVSSDALTRDAANNVYLTGFFSGTVDFDPGPGVFNLTTANTGTGEIFVSKLDPAGNFLWAKKIGGSTDSRGQSIALDVAGNVYTTGYFSGTADFDPGPGFFNLVSAGSGDNFVCKLDASGNFIWAKSMGGTGSESGYDLTLDVAGNVYTTGYFSGTADFDPEPGAFNLVSAGSSDIFVVKLSPCAPLTAPTLNASGSTSLCPGQSITLNASNICAGCAVNWSNGQTGTAITVSAPGNYTATGTNACGTSPSSNAIAVTTAAAPTAPAVTASGPTVLCEGQSVVLTASNVCAGCSVNWSNGQSGTSITVSAVGNYTATGNNSCGTSPASNAIAVTMGAAPNSPSVSASGSTSLCPGQSVTLTASNVCAGCTVNWSSGQSGTSITVSAAGNYVAIQHNSCGTSAISNSVAVTMGTAPVTPTVSASGSTSLCPGQSVTLTALNVCAGCTVNWSNGQLGTSIDVSAAGTYTATLNNPCGTSPASNAVAVTTGAAPSAPNVSASGPTSLCPGESVTLTASNVCAGCMVNWSNGQTGTAITVSMAGNYTAVLNNPCGTSPASNTIAVTTGAAPSAPNVSASGPMSLCVGESVTLTASNVCAGCMVNWSNGQSGASIIVSTAGLYSAVYSNNCGGGPSSPGITVTMSPAFVPAVQVNNLCQLAAPTGSGYQWYLNGTIIPGASGQFWSAQASGYYVVTMSNPAGCSGASDPLFAEACVSSAQDPSEQMPVRLYPNPAQDRIFIELQTPEPVSARLELFAADGRYVGALFRGIVLPGGQALEIALPELPAGAYHYRLSTELGSANGIIVLKSRP